PGHLFPYPPRIKQYKISSLTAACRFKIIMQNRSSPIIDTMKVKSLHPSAIPRAIGREAAASLSVLALTTIAAP
ncbi:hypothetical protein ACWGQ6_39070, partial [Streptomyces niveus]